MRAGAVSGRCQHELLAGTERREIPFHRSQGKKKRNRYNDRLAGRPFPIWNPDVTYPCRGSGSPDRGQYVYRMSRSASLGYIATMYEKVFVL